MYHFKDDMVNATVNAPSLRTVDAHSVPHRKSSKAARAVDAADLVDGYAVLQNPTIRLAAATYGVSVGSVTRARRLTPEQRQEVRRGWRPLIIPHAKPSLPVPPPSASPLIEEAHAQLLGVVSHIGWDATLDLLATIEKVAA